MSSNPQETSQVQAAFAAPHGAAIIAAIKQAGVQYVLSVPDIVTSAGLLFPIARDPSLKLVRVCKEDEAVAISAALSICGKRALLLIQHTGLLDSINAIRAVAMEYGMPVVMMVGLLEKEAGVPPRKSRRYGVRIVEPILDAMGMNHRLIETDADVPWIQSAIEDAYAQSKPVALLIGQRPKP
jgi:sulfopyruvate decarboxylase TPP-binding subunit